MADNFMYFATANDVGTSSPGGATKGTPARLESVTVGTAAASAVLTIYHGIDTNGPVVATIDCSAINNFQFGSRRRNLVPRRPVREAHGRECQGHP